MAKSVLGAVVQGFILGAVTGIMVWAVLGCLFLMLISLSLRPVASLYFILLAIAAILWWLVQTHPWTAATIYGIMLLVALAVSWGRPAKDAYARSFIVGILTVPPAVYISLMIGPLL